MESDNECNKYVKLISAEGMEFFTERKIAVGSETIKAMLEGNFREAEDNVIRLPEIQGPVLEKVVQYLHYKERHGKATGRIPEFVIEPEIALELLVASNYLNC
mmetsp:Transcript_6565/g.9594  ORF Transcript_6565/g.9594 Transcript_6565/m.9594 type:complete len:103 (-) Transcript_6565:403-711(-)|eukprot:CAMPEP_0194073546 /NCGR_PEP_ID=MMETSP0149-20130528/934_1 /TAXON_ID=122233 /ORGANISM="Chaetoceros debilis, Strain MM31A-1" /LENGTH=102 /DNA_ID=CAMNT_0038753577 /DNA_START=126 /DNA_END=434 /DNA_ORIENTATION=+